MDGGSQECGRGRNRHAYKVLAVGPSGISRLRVVADIKARQPRDTADEKEETDESPGLPQVLVQLGVD